MFKFLKSVENYSKVKFREKYLRLTVINVISFLQKYNK